MTANAQLILRSPATVNTVARFRGCSPIVLDNSESLGRANTERLEHLRRLSKRRTTCVAIHMVFANDVYAQILAPGATLPLSKDWVTRHFSAISTAQCLAESSALTLGRVQSQTVPLRQA